MGVCHSITIKRKTTDASSHETNTEKKGRSPIIRIKDKVRFDYNVVVWTKHCYLIIGIELEPSSDSDIGCGVRLRCHYTVRPGLKGPPSSR